MQRTYYEYLIGQEMDEDVIDEYGALVVPRKTVITKEIATRMGRHPIGRLPAAKPVDYADSVHEALVQIHQLFRTASEENRIHLESVRERIVPRILVVTEQPQINQLLYDLRIKDEYTVAHSFAVSVLATLIGKWMNLEHERLHELVVAAALHDVGKAKIPADILNKPGRLTPDEYDVVRKHTIYGYELIRGTPGTTEADALAALQHHERIDGSGYPQGLKQDQISLFAKIIGIADVFHAMSSKRVYHDSLPVYEILNSIKEGMFGGFDPVIVSVFLERMMTSLIGSDVVLSNGMKARIVMLAPTDPTLPLVQTTTGFVDLSTDKSVTIVAWS